MFALSDDLDMTQMYCIMMGGWVRLDTGVGAWVKTGMDDAGVSYIYYK